MGYVELRDGISNRRFQVPELPGTVRIDVAGADGPSIAVPETVAVTHERRSSL